MLNLEAIGVVIAAIFGVGFLARRTPIMFPCRTGQRREAFTSSKWVCHG